MKLYNKSDLAIIDGMLVADDGSIVLPDRRIIEQANELETLSQKHAYLAKQPSATPAPNLDGFERKSIKDSDLSISAHTPILDMKAEEAMALMDEIDDIATVNHANAMIDSFSELLAFTKADYVVGRESDGMIELFDTPTLGSVLELTRDDILEVIFAVCGMDTECIGIAHGDDLVRWDERDGEED